MNTYYVGPIPITDELYHHGILGQKWGVRRYQNPDGTLTAAGRKRYGYSIGESTDPRASAKNDIDQVRDIRKEYGEVSRHNPASKKIAELSEALYNKYSELANKYGSQSYKKALDDYIHSEDDLKAFYSDTGLMKKYGYDDEHGIDIASETSYRASKKYLESIGIDSNDWYSNAGKKQIIFDNEARRNAEKLLGKNNNDSQDLYIILREHGYNEQTKHYESYNGDSVKSNNKAEKHSRFGFSSTIPRGELTEKGKQKYGDDPSLMSKGKFKRQVLRNQAWGDNTETKRIDREMNKYFKETKNAYNGENYLKTYKKIDQYVTDMARARLKDMGYTPNDKAVEYLRNQPWFFNSVPLSYMLPPEKQPH